MHKSASWKYGNIPESKVSTRFSARRRISRQAVDVSWTSLSCE
jgi:hypothetical protein